MIPLLSITHYVIIDLKEPSSLSLLSKLKKYAPVVTCSKFLITPMNPSCKAKFFLMIDLEIEIRGFSVA